MNLQKVMLPLFTSSLCNPSYSYVSRTGHVFHRLGTYVLRDHLAQQRCSGPFLYMPVDWLSPRLSSRYILIIGSASWTQPSQSSPSLIRKQISSSLDVWRLPVGLVYIYAGFISKTCSDPSSSPPRNLPFSSRCLRDNKSLVQDPHSPY